MPGPRRVRYGGKSPQVADRNRRSPLGYDSVRTQLSFQKHAARGPISADAELGASVGAGPMEDVERGGIVVNAGDAIGVAGAAGRIGIGTEALARPSPD